MKLIKEIDFVPQEKFVVTFDKYRTFTSKYTVMDQEKNKGKDPLKDEMETKVVSKKVKFNIQVARVIAVPTTEVEYKVGDEIIVDMHNCIDLNGYKDLYLMARYQIVGKK